MKLENENKTTNPKFNVGDTVWQVFGPLGMYERPRIYGWRVAEVVITKGSGYETIKYRPEGFAGTLVEEKYCFGISEEAQSECDKLWAYREEELKAMEKHYGKKD